MAPPRGLQAGSPFDDPFDNPAGPPPQPTAPPPPPPPAPVDFQTDPGANLPPPEALPPLPPATPPPPETVPGDLIGDIPPPPIPPPPVGLGGGKGEGGTTFALPGTPGARPFRTPAFYTAHPPRFGPGVPQPGSTGFDLSSELGLGPDQAAEILRALAAGRL